MTDFADRASEREAIFLEESLAKHQITPERADSLSHCEDCGSQIPEARRKQSKAAPAASFAKNISNTDGLKNGKNLYTHRILAVGRISPVLPRHLFHLRQNAAGAIPRAAGRTPKTARAPARQSRNHGNKLAEFNAGLPLTYVLREDYIRNQVVLEAKLDNVAEKLTEIYKMESVKK